jgi:hypothetical protein
VVVLSQALESDTKVLAYEAGRKHKVRSAALHLICSSVWTITREMQSVALLV